MRPCLNAGVTNIGRLMGHPPPTSPKERLIFALDVEHIDEAERLIKTLAPHVGMFKVGSTLFTNAGAQVLDMIHTLGSSVFLDLKFHDIPAQVTGAAREVARKRAKMFTVHALGGGRMIEGAVRELQSMTVIPGFPPPMCLAVTMLTSHAPEELPGLGLSDPMVEQVRRLAQLAVKSGAQGIVASGHELPALREVLPESTVFVTPGIRGPGDDLGDQSRVMTAGAALKAGATYVVVGRPIRTAKSPVDAAKRIVEDMEKVSA